MSETAEKGVPRWFHEQLLVVSGLFAGFSFMALMVMLQSSESFRAQSYSDAYFVLLVIVLAIVSSDLIACCFGMSLAASGIDPQGRLWNFNEATFFIGLFGLGLFIPLMVFPVSWVTDLTVSVFEVLLFVWFSKGARHMEFSGR